MTRAFQVVLEVKNPPYNAGDIRHGGLSLGLGRSPGGEHGNPLQDSCLENPHEERSLVGYSPWGHKRVRHDWSDWAAHMHGVAAESGVHFGQRRWYCTSFLSKGFTFIARVLTGFFFSFPIFAFFSPLPKLNPPDWLFQSFCPPLSVSAGQRETLPVGSALKRRPDLGTDNTKEERRDETEAGLAEWGGRNRKDSRSESKAGAWHRAGPA